MTRDMLATRTANAELAPHIVALRERIADGTYENDLKTSIAADRLLDAEFTATTGLTTNDFRWQADVCPCCGGYHD